MVEFERIYGDRVNLFGAILGRISRPNKLPLQRYAMILIHPTYGFITRAQFFVVVA
jgi:hypothetical protein